MIFNSLEFMLFFPVAAVLYYVLPGKLKNPWLLFASYFYYMSAAPQYAVYLLLSTFVTYAGGLAIGNAGTNRKRKLSVCVFTAVNLFALIAFKCGGLFVDGGLLVPVGMSFYTFQSTTYLIGIYRDELPPRRDFITYALFVSFFPNILAGPIERAKHLLPQFDERHVFSYEGIRLGLFQMLWGYFLKMVLAERFAIAASLIFDNYRAYAGFEVLFGIFCYSMQIYCDFFSYSTIAVGAARVLGFSLVENFRQPYFAVSVADFWRRWHISLSTWFRDYLYIPLGGSRKGRLRKYGNLMIVFLVSGLWHGSAWNYILWGGLNGVYQVIGDLCRPVRQRLEQGMPRKLFYVLSVVVTFLLIGSTWVFFRSRDLEQAFGVFAALFSVFNPRILLNGRIFELGLGVKNLLLLAVSFLFLIAFDVYNERQQDEKNAYERVFSLPLLLRWGIYYFLAGMILLSSNLSSSEFIYMKY